MPRFTQIISDLHTKRLEQLKKAQKKPRKRKKSVKKKEPMTFDAPELERLFNQMPKELQTLIETGE